MLSIQQERISFLKKFSLLILRGRNREISICCSTCICILWLLLYVPWPEIESAAMVYPDDVLTNWATGAGQDFSNIKFKQQEKNEWTCSTDKIAIFLSFFYISFWWISCLSSSYLKPENGAGQPQPATGPRMWDVLSHRPAARNGASLATAAWSRPLSHESAEPQPTLRLIKINSCCYMPLRTWGCFYMIWL